MADNGALPRFFIAYVSASSSESLAIPLSFNEHLRNPMPKVAKLQGREHKIWKVNMVKGQEYIYFTNGWRLFAEDNNLTDGEFLTFVYDGSLTFEVSIYNRFGCKKIRSLVNQQDTMDVDDRSDSHDDAEGPPETDDAEGRSNTDDAAAGSATVVPNASTPCFEIKIKPRRYELFIPMYVVKDHKLRFGNWINYIDEFGTLKGKRSNWRNQRIVFRGWNHVCERNMLKDEELVVCELLHNQNLVHSVKVNLLYDPLLPFR